MIDLTMKMVKMTSLKLTLGINPTTKAVYTVLKEGFASGLFLLMRDSDLKVVISAMAVMVEYFYAFRKKNF